MADQDRGRAMRLVDKRIAKKGLRPRLAAGVIATLWVISIVIFGIVEHLVDPKSFGTIWQGMWWATQTVTTVGYGDVVPDQVAGKLIACVLMIGGLSFFAVITGSITSIFVTRAQESRRESGDDPVMRKLDEMSAELEAIKRNLAGLSDDGPAAGPRPQDPEPSA